MSFDADSASGLATDTIVESSATQTRQFGVGVVITGVNSTAFIKNLFAFQFQVSFDPSVLTAQGVPPALGQPSANAVTFGQQASHNWQGLLDAQKAFATLRVDKTAGKVGVGYTLLGDPSLAQNITSPNILARINFEINKATSPASTTLTLSMVHLVTCVPQPSPNPPKCSLFTTDSIGDTIDLTDKSVTETVTNRPPLARFTFAPANPVKPNATGPTTNVTFNATGSIDTDGTITSFIWDFSDGLGEQSLGPGPFKYALPGLGRFNVTLRVVDNLGATGGARDVFDLAIVDSQPSHTVRTIVVDTPPVANFTVTKRTPLVGEMITFNGTRSYDPDPGGRVTTYAWDFGDGTQGTNKTIVTHAYATYGTFKANLTVTDDLGVTNPTTINMTVDALPIASFTASKTSVARGEVITLDAHTSLDPDGDAITTYVWDFGDGSPRFTGVIQTHSYSSLGSYTVRLNVTDARGSKGTITQVIAVVNQNPIVSFTPDKTLASSGDTITLTVSASDADGDPVTVKVAWGDGRTEIVTGSTISHIYTADGTYHLVINATDQFGGLGSSSKDITIDAPPTLTLTQDKGSLPAGETVSLSLTATDDGTITSVRIDWGDGSTPDSFTNAVTSANHKYGSQGTFTVTITVTNDKGRTVQKNATVTVTPAQTFPLPGGPLLWVVLAAVAAVGVGAFLALRRKTRLRSPNSSRK